MTVRDGTVAGMPARIARVSFTGELAYEINVEGWLGRPMWEAVMAAGEPFGVTPYGTEAMHLLRAEKGFVIVGQDTDGTVTPGDLGMSWIVRKDDSDFVGRRSLSRPDTMRPDRKQLVGLLPVDPDAWLPEGAQMVAPTSVGMAPPVPMLGHVTSSYRSPTLGRTFALAMVAGGRDLIGTTARGAAAGRRHRSRGHRAGLLRRAERTPRRRWSVTTARDPLAARVDDLARIAQVTDGAVVLEHVPFLAQVNLRLDPTLAGRAPYPLPVDPNTAWEDGPRAALWLGPDEWVILGPPHAGREIVAELDAALDGLHRSIVDVSANRVAVEISGPRAKEILSKGCSIDLHPSMWAPGMCAQTMLGKAQVVLHERADTTGIAVRTSFANYLIDWFVAAAG